MPARKVLAVLLLPVLLSTSFPHAVSSQMISPISGRSQVGGVSLPSPSLGLNPASPGLVSAAGLGTPASLAPSSFLVPTPRLVPSAPAAVPAAVAPTGLSAAAALGLSHEGLAADARELPPDQARHRAQRSFEGGALKAGVSLPDAVRVSAGAAVRSGAALEPSKPSSGSTGAARVPSPGPRRLRTWHKWVLAAVMLVAAAAAGYQLLAPRLRPQPPPATAVVSERSPYGMRLDPGASVVKGADAANPALALSLLGHKDAVESVTASADGRAVVTVARDGSWRIWDLEKGTSYEATGYPGKARGALFADGGRTLILVDQDSTVRVLDRTTNEVRTITQGGGAVALHSISPDAQRVAVARRDGKVQVLALDSATAAAFQAEGKVLALGSTTRGTMLLTSRRGILKLWAIAPGRDPVVVAEKYAPGVELIGSQFSADGSKVIAAAEMAGDQGAAVWSVGTQDFQLVGMEDLGGAGTVLAAVAMDASGFRAALLAADGRVWLWEPASGSPRLLGRAGAGARVFFSDDGKSLFSTDPAGPVRAWRLP